MKEQGAKEDEETKGTKIGHGRKFAECMALCSVDPGCQCSETVFS